MEAEEEKILKHAKNAVHSLTDKKKTWKAKIGGFLVEIIIIIIAVNITIWFHNWNEKRHDRKLEKEFLIGIRSDLVVVKNNLNYLVDEYYQPTIAYYDSVWIQMNEHRIDKKFIDDNSWFLKSDAKLYINNGRFENFKSSGDLRLIENDSLLISINSLYTGSLPAEAEVEERMFSKRQEEYVTYIGSIARIDFFGKIYLSELLNNSGVIFQISYQKSILENRKQQILKLIQTITPVINQIDKELKDRFDYTFPNTEKNF